MIYKVTVSSITSNVIDVDLVDSLTGYEMESVVRSRLKSTGDCLYSADEKTIVYLLDMSYSGDARSTNIKRIRKECVIFDRDIKINKIIE